MSLHTLKNLRTKGTASAVPHKAKLMRALAPEVRLFPIVQSNYLVTTISRPIEMVQNNGQIEKRTSAAKAVECRRHYGTAEAVPFVQTLFWSGVEGQAVLFSI